jgi:hypothetical protein
MEQRLSGPETGREPLAYSGLGGTFVILLPEEISKYSSSQPVNTCSEIMGRSKSRLYHHRIICLQVLRLGLEFDDGKLMNLLVSTKQENSDLPSTSGSSKLTGNCIANCNALL